MFEPILSSDNHRQVNGKSDHPSHNDARNKACEDNVFHRVPTSIKQNERPNRAKDTASQAREYFFNNYRKRFAQSRLTEGDVLKGRDMANEQVVRSYSKRLYQDLSGVEFVLLEAGEDALIFFNENLIISIDKALGKVTIQMTVPIVTQLREIAATMKIAFSTNA